MSVAISTCITFSLVQTLQSVRLLLSLSTLVIETNICIMHHLIVVFTGAYVSIAVVAIVAIIYFIYLLLVLIYPHIC